MGHSINTEHVVSDCRGRAGSLGNMQGPELWACVLKMQIDQITALLHFFSSYPTWKAKDSSRPPYTQTRFPLKLIKLKLLGPTQASFKSLERVLETFYMMNLFGVFFAKFAKEYFNHDQLRSMSLSILTSSSHTFSNVRSYWNLGDLAKTDLNLEYM